MLADRNKRFILVARNSVRNISIWISFKYISDNSRHEPITTLLLTSWLQNKHRCFQVITSHQVFSATMNKMVFFENVNKVWQCNTDQFRPLPMSLNAKKRYHFSIDSLLLTFSTGQKINSALQPTINVIIKDTFIVNTNEQRSQHFSSNNPVVNISPTCMYL